MVAEEASCNRHSATGFLRIGATASALRTTLVPWAAPAHTRRATARATCGSDAAPSADARAWQLAHTVVQFCARARSCVCVWSICTAPLPPPFPHTCTPHRPTHRHRAPPTTPPPLHHTVAVPTPALLAATPFRSPRAARGAWWCAPRIATPRPSRATAGPRQARARPPRAAGQVGRHRRAGCACVHVRVWRWQPPSRRLSAG